MKPQIFKKDDVALFHIAYGFFHVLAYAVVHFLNTSFKKRRKPLGHGSKGQFRLDLSLRTPQVAHKDDLPPVIKNILYCRQGRYDPAVIRDVPFLVKRDVKIRAHEHAFPLNLHILDGLFHASPLLLCNVADEIDHAV